nr:pre mRNA splicing factor 38A [Hymenolepis microstoma]
MANRTVKDAHTLHGTNPQYLIEKIIRSRIYECQFWKEHCFALTSELLVDKAVELKYIGGTYSGLTKPTPFICLVLKMLQIQPDKDIVIEFIKQEDYKYARALGAFYLRLVGESVEIYKYLEALYNDFRKLKQQDTTGKFSIIRMDEFIDQLLNEERACDVILPRLQKRSVLEDSNLLEPRQSILDEDLEDINLNEALEDEQQESDDGKDRKEHKRARYRDTNDSDSEERRRRRHRRREDSPYRPHDRSERDRERDRDKRRDRDERDRDRRRRSRSCSRDHRRDGSDSDRRRKDRDRGHRH